MGIISQEKARNYLPLDVKTRLSCCQRRANSGWSVKKICSYYHVSRQSLWRWMARFDGSEGSLADRSNRPHSECDWKTPEKTAHKIECLANCRRRDNLSSVDIWVKALSAGCEISYSTMLRILKKIGGYEPYRSNPKKKHSGRYHTPEHNGKVERSHRIDQEKFYRSLRFYSLDGLRKQGKAWMGRYNSTPRMALRPKSPNQAELDSLKRIMESTGEVRCPRLLKCSVSADN